MKYTEIVKKLTEDLAQITIDEFYSKYSPTFWHSDLQKHVGEPLFLESGFSETSLVSPKEAERRIEEHLTVAVHPPLTEAKKLHEQSVRDASRIEQQVEKVQRDMRMISAPRIEEEIKTLKVEVVALKPLSDRPEYSRKIQVLSDKIASAEQRLVGLKELTVEEGRLRESLKEHQI
jgi:hypothetical protein